MTGAVQQTGLTHRLRNVVSMLTQTNAEEDKAMLKYKGKLQLTKKERTVLELMMFSPILVVFAVLHTTHSYLSTLVGFHIALTVGPILFLRYKKININWIDLIKQDLAKHTRNLNTDAMLAAAPLTLIGGLYTFFRIMFPDYDYTTLRMPSVNDQLIAILLTIEFVIINPIVEELFWRVFCDLFTGQGKTFAQVMDVSLHFGCYHWFVAYFITQDPYLSTVGFLAVSGLGVFLAYIKKNYGVLTATIIHVGVDIAAVLAMLDLQARFIPFY